jgi:hypothetical protein
MLIPTLISCVIAKEKSAFDVAFTLNDGYSFECRIGEIMEFKHDTIRLYDSCKILHNKKSIHKFDTIAEFESKSGYPYSVTKGDHTYIYAYLNDRPLKDCIYKLDFSNDKLKRIDTMPFMPMEPFQLDSTDNRYLVGLCNSYEMWDGKMPYDPVLIYRDDSGDINLDTMKTKEINTRIYGKFYGFKYRENQTFKIKTTQPKLDQVLDEFKCSKISNIKCRK